MAVTWLHISDLHVRSDNSYDRAVVFQALVSSVRHFRESDGRCPDLIFATGDIAHSGKPDEYSFAAKFLALAQMASLRDCMQTKALPL